MVKNKVNKPHSFTKADLNRYVTVKDLNICLDQNERSDVGVFVLKEIKRDYVVLHGGQGIFGRSFKVLKSRVVFL